MSREYLKPSLYHHQHVRLFNIHLSDPMNHDQNSVRFVSEETYIVEGHQNQIDSIFYRFIHPPHNSNNNGYDKSCQPPPKGILYLHHEDFNRKKPTL